MRAEVNEHLCIGCGLCCEMVPEMFEVGDFTAKVKLRFIPEGLEERVRAAAEDCPVSAIRFADDIED